MYNRWEEFLKLQGIKMDTIKHVNYTKLPTLNNNSNNNI